MLSLDILGVTSCRQRMKRKQLRCIPSDPLVGKLQERSDAPRGVVPDVGRRVPVGNQFFDGLGDFVPCIAEPPPPLAVRPRLDSFSTKGPTPAGMVK